MLYVDIPSLSDISQLSTVRSPYCVTVYLPTTPITQQAQADRIALKNLAKSALEQIKSAGASASEAEAVSEQFDDLLDDNIFWQFQARSLALFVTPDRLRIFRLPSKLNEYVGVSTRFNIGPLLRSISFPNPATYWHSHKNL